MLDDRIEIITRRLGRRRSISVDKLWITAEVEGLGRSTTHFRIFQLAEILPSPVEPVQARTLGMGY